MRKGVFVLFLIVLLLSLTGCGGRSVSNSYLRENVDFAFVERVGVLPIQNNSGDQYVAQRTRDLVITKILSYGLFDVVEKDLVDSALYDEAVTPGKTIDPLTLKRLGSRLNAQAFVLGTVDLAGTDKIGQTSYPVMALTLRLVEANSGLILWQASANASGESLANRLLGLRGMDSYQINDKLVSDLLRTAPNY